MCDAWLQNKLVNPDTGRQINLDGPTYRAWKFRCKDQMRLYGHHPGFTYLNSELRELLNPYQIRGKDISNTIRRGPMSTTTGVYKLLALELLKKIYVPPAKPRSQLIISGVFNST